MISRVLVAASERLWAFADSAGPDGNFLEIHAVALIASATLARAALRLSSRREVNVS